jgi:hypothetical protein
MTLYTRNMNQTATYWPFASVDGYGQSSFSSPVQILCRWENKAVLFRNAQGQEMTSQSIVYPAVEIGVKGYLKRGTDATADPVGLDDAYEVQQVNRSPALDNSKELLKVFL